MDDPNPYSPPEADLGLAREPGRYRPLITVIRVVIGLWGLFILAGPSRYGDETADRGREIAGKALGALLFMVSVFPIRKPGNKRREVREDVAEDL